MEVKKLQLENEHRHTAHFVSHEEKSSPPGDDFLLKVMEEIKLLIYTSHIQDKHDEFLSQYCQLPWNLYMFWHDANTMLEHISLCSMQKQLCLGQCARYTDVRHETVLKIMVYFVL